MTDPAKVDALTLWQYTALISEWKARQPEHDWQPEPPSREEYEEAKAAMLARHSGRAGVVTPPCGLIALDLSFNAVKRRNDSRESKTHGACAETYHPQYLVNR